MNMKMNSKNKTKSYFKLKEFNYTLFGACGIFACLITGLSLGACSNKKESKPVFPSPVAKAAMAIISDDSTAFAEVCIYPIERPYPLRDIETPKQMSSYYNIIADDSLKKTVRESKPEQWIDYGWRGYSLKDGEYVWIDEKIYDIPYISAQEQHLLDSLRKEEMLSLPAEMRKGWIPTVCLEDSVSQIIYRIDNRENAQEDTDSVYRISIYENRAKLRHHPHRHLSGRAHSEGSAGVRTILFTATSGDSIIYYPDDRTDNGKYPMEWHKKGKSPDAIYVKKVYWRDLLKGNESK